MWYALILTCVLMFGSGFWLQDMYRRKRGSGLRISMESACIGALAGFIVLLLIDGFSFTLTPFTLLIAVLNALNNMAFAFFAFRALDRINLSLFSVFTMLGGMALPFFQGILFYGEGISLAKILCVIFIVIALLCTIEKGEKKHGTIYYIGIFILNGMAGVLAKTYTESSLPKASAAGFSAWSALSTALLSGAVCLILIWKQKRMELPDAQRTPRKALFQSFGIGALMGSINKVANFLLVLSLVHVDASVQYPMVTGGTMIVSTIFSCFGDKKPNKREIISVCFAFAGMLSLFLLPN